MTIDLNAMPIGPQPIEKKTGQELVCHDEYDEFVPINPKLMEILGSMETKPIIIDNPINIDTIPAGPEMDRLIAEVVMGVDLTANRDEEALARAVLYGMDSSDGRGNADWTWNNTTYKSIPLPKGGFHCRPGLASDGYGLLLWEQRQGQPWQADLEAHVQAWRSTAKAYSTEPGPAMEVVKKMGEENYWFSSDIMPLVNGTPVTITAQACFQKCPIMDKNPEHHAHAETFELAVCRAAYKAKLHSRMKSEER